MSDDVESAEEFAGLVFGMAPKASVTQLIETRDRLIRAAERERIAKFFDRGEVDSIGRTAARMIRAMGHEK